LGHYPSAAIKKTAWIPRLKKMGRGAQKKWTKKRMSRSWFRADATAASFAASRRRAAFSDGRLASTPGGTIRSVARNSLADRARV